MLHRFMRYSAAVASGAAISIASARALGAQSMQDEAATVRQDLRALPGYSVFDLITFHVNPDHSVTLGGYVTSKDTKKEAEHAIATDKSIMARVENKIEQAPISTTDERLRHEVFTAIYHDKFLAQYGTAADQAASEVGRRSPWGTAYSSFGEFSTTRWTGSPFYGQEPIGNYAIHILVKHGTVTLAGVVATQDDKNAAGRDAMRVHDVHDLNNDLHVSGK